MPRQWLKHSESGAWVIQDQELMNQEACESQPLLDRSLPEPRFFRIGAEGGVLTHQVSPEHRAVVEFLRGKNGPKVRRGILNGKRVDYFKGASASFNV